MLKTLPFNPLHTRGLSLLLLLAAAALGVFIALHHPLWQPVPLLGFVLAAAWFFVNPGLWLVIVPALLPLLGLAPWTGWISFEEVDLLILAAAVGGYARCAYRTSACSLRLSWSCLFLAGLMSISLLLAMTRGFADAGGFVFGWYQGYDGPMNSVRIARSFFLALLMVPLMAPQHDQSATAVARKLALGMALGLATASLAALWERLAFTDLLNFSSDYRSTALFWEMHVGGAALDGWLLLTFPFAIWALRNAVGAPQSAIALTLVGLAAYASLTTFSRGVYLALLVSIPLLLWQTRSKGVLGEAGDQAPHWGVVRWVVAIACLAAMARLVFPYGGYRGLLALFGVVVVALSTPLVLRNTPPGRLLAGSVLGFLLGALLVVFSNFLPKGPYVLFALLFFSVFGLLHAPKVMAARFRPAICLGGFVCLALAAANVSGHWGGVEALPGSCLALAMLFLVVLVGALARQPLWPADWRWQGGLLTIAMVVSGTVAVFFGGAYMGDRFSTSGQDLDWRLSHWKQAVALLETSGDVAFGKGLGRFPANYYFAAPNGASPGAYQVRGEGGQTWLYLTGARHPMSFGDIFRVSQRLDLAAQGPFELKLKVRTGADVGIHAEVCAKHLLYSADCAIGTATIKSSKGTWQPVQLRLEGKTSAGGAWYAPRLKMFSVGILNQGGAADVDDLVLTAGGSDNLLANGDFGQEMQRWFFTSDHEHLPWHAKNVLVNILFDQGALGLTVFLVLTLGALWRLNLGKARGHRLSPYLTASIIGFLAVGMFDSLTDVPRLAFIYYLLVLYAISLVAFGPPPTTLQATRQTPSPREAV